MLNIVLARFVLARFGKRAETTPRPDRVFVQTRRGTYCVLNETCRPSSLLLGKEHFHVQWCLWPSWCSQISIVHLRHFLLSLFYHSQVRWDSIPPNLCCVHPQRTTFQQNNTIVLLKSLSWLKSTASLCILLCREQMLDIVIVKRRKQRLLKFEWVLNFPSDSTFFLLWILGKVKRSFGRVFLVCCSSSLV